MTLPRMLSAEELQAQLSLMVKEITRLKAIISKKNEFLQRLVPALNMAGNRPEPAFHGWRREFYELSNTCETMSEEE